jgi:hypothetical protein
MSDLIEELYSYSLFTLQSRIYKKLLLFAHGIKSNKKSPVELQALIDLPAPVEESAEIIPAQGVYELRRGRTLVKNIIPDTKYEILDFKRFFPKLLNTFKNFDFSLSKSSVNRVNRGLSKKIS